MKKFFGIIALTVMVLAVVPQVMAQDAQVLERLLADFMAGRITEAEFNRRVLEFEGGLAEQENQERQAQQQRDREDQQRREQERRERSQWPSNAVLAQVGLSGLRQPNGARNVSWRNDGNDYELAYIYIENGNRAMFNDIVRQISNIIGYNFTIANGAGGLGDYDANGVNAAVNSDENRNRRPYRIELWPKYNNQIRIWVGGVR